MDVKWGAERGRIIAANGVLIVVDCNWQHGYYRRVQPEDIFFENAIDGCTGFTDWGDSLFTRVDQVLQQYDQTWAGVANLMMQPASADTWPAWAERQNGATPPLHVEKASISSTSRRALQDACTAALNLLRDLPTRNLDAPMRTRVLEVERALVDALQPESDADVLATAERGSACARMVAAYDD